MNYVDLNFPGCAVDGFLWYGNDDPGRLTQDMLEIVLPNDIVIAAGWYPEADPKGSYKIIVFRGETDLIPPIRTTSIQDAVLDIHGLVNRFMKTVQFGGATGESPAVELVGQYRTSRRRQMA